MNDELFTKTDSLECNLDVIIKQNTISYVDQVNKATCNMTGAIEMQEQQKFIGHYMNANQTVVSGRKTQTIESIQGKENKELTWLIKGNGKITIDAGSPTTGSKSIEVTL